MTKLQLKPLKIDSCGDCPLANTGQLCPDMPTSGKGKLGAMIVGECQGALEAQKGSQFIGPAGQLLRTVLASLNLDLDRDFWKTNAIRCRTNGGKPPTTGEINSCNVKLFKSIHKRKPKMVIALGKSAVIALVGKYVKDITISKFRGTFIPITEHNFYLVSALHPSFVSRCDDDYSYETLRRDLKEGLSLLKHIPDSPITPLNISKPIRLVTSFKTFSALMEKLHREKPVSAFDFETSSKKPQDSRSRIWSMSICFNGKSYSFPVHYPAVQGVYPKDAADTIWGTQLLPLVMDKIKGYLQDSGLKKIAHNEAFERIWSHFVFESPVNSLIWCSMNAQHILDARKGFCGLKLQAFLRWGVHGYDDEMKFYMKKSQEDRGANSLNILYKAPLEKLLFYGGVDSFLTEKLAKEQLEVFNLRGNKPLHKARKLFHETTIAFTNSQKTGINIDTAYYKKVRASLTKSISKLTQDIQSTNEVKQFEETEQVEFNLNSPPDLRVLLFDILGERSKKKTTTGLDSVDKDVLTDLKTPIGKKIIKIRELKKLRDTYIAQYLREAVKGRIYPFINTHIARSGRSSSSAPNIQNCPQRDEKAKKLIRWGIIPSLGYKLVECDFSSIEIRMLGVETKDKALLKYLWNPKSDMHYDQAKSLFLLDADEMNKAIRYVAKSDFVFLEVYGGKASASAKYLWFDSVDLKTGKESDGLIIRKHLAKQGIRNLDDFTDHVRDVESNFWKKYTGIKRWQKTQGEFYLQHGYVETHFGFRRGGYLKWEVILNTQTQSTAAHLLWWCFKRIDQIRIKEKWKTKLLGQIHDSIIFDMHPEEEAHVMKTTHRVMTRESIGAFPWIIVPIDIEIDMAEVNQPWYSIKAVPKDYYKSLASKEEIMATRASLKSRVLKC